MPKCQNCGYQWSWRETAALGFRNSRLCPNCRRRQFVKPQWKTRTVMLYMLPLWLLLFARPLFDLHGAVYHTLAILLIVSMVVITPYTIKLSNEQEPLW